MSQIWSLQNPPKIDANMQSKMTSEKIRRKSNSEIHFGLQHSRKSFRKATRNEACFATQWKPPGNREKLLGGVVCKACKWLGI